MPFKRHSAKTYIDGIKSNNRQLLSRAITLIESRLPYDRQLAQEVLLGVSSVVSSSIRIGITGVPGVGKSTFIEALGDYLTSQNLKVAVLSIDPSSQRSKGSIMGDKTRMETLSHNPLAFIRPSPTGGSLGGVTDTTHETILLFEAAGYDVIIVETVGVGQSETAVKNIVDFFLLLLLPGAGDELQGIKRGIMEMADAVVINKADENKMKAKLAQAEYSNALHLFPATHSGWYPRVQICSALQKTGISEIWEIINAFEIQCKENGFWQQQRQKQRITWMYSYIQRQLNERFFATSAIKQALPTLEIEIQNGTILPITAAEQLIALFGR